jgi:hypothetical protein
MALPSVSADDISAAMAQFDSELRSNPQWARWEATQPTLPKGTGSRNHNRLAANQMGG